MKSLFSTRNLVMLAVIAGFAFAANAGYLSPDVMVGLSALSFMGNMAPTTAETLALMKAAQAKPDEVLKAYVQPGSATTGLQAYNLEPAAKQLYPLMTPLRNEIPRVTGGFAIQANWKAVTGINTANQRAGVSEGKRGGIIAQATAEYLAAFRGFGLENSASFEAQYAAKNFDDVRARAVSDLLASTMIQEEKVILGGNTSVAMGTTPMPTLANAGTGGTIAAGTWSVICVALGVQAYLDLAGANNGATGQAFVASSAVLSGQITRTNTDGSTDTFGDGSAQKSASATTTTSGSTSTISASVAAVNGAVGYAWYVGAAGTEKLAAMSTINSAVFTSIPGSGQLASALAASDNSTSALDFDGLLYQAFKPGSGATIMVQATGAAGVGTGLTSDGAGGIVEFEQMFATQYNKYRTSPTKIYVSVQELINITKKIIGNGGAPLLKLNANINAATGAIAAGVVVGSYWNKVTGQEVPLVVHPNMPAGTVFFFTKTLPYPLSNVGETVRMLMRQDYYQLEWPLKTRKYEYGVYADGVLQHYAPFSMGVITNIANA
jgi:hypothetical protein